MSQKKTRDDPMAMQRGDYRNPLLPVFIFCLGRLINIPIQLGIITRIPLSSLISRPAPPAGGHPINLHLTSPINSFFYPFLPKSALSNDTLTLTPYQALIAFMSTWLVTKHLIWVTCLRRERLTINFSIVASIMDGVFEALESFAFTFAAVNPFFSGKMVLLGLLMHVPAVLLELAAEVQRKRFKDDKRNEGKICMRGAWGMARHINYGCNMIFGFGFGLACGGLPIALLFGGVYFMNFTYNAGPSIEEYCRAKYRDKWDIYCQRVPRKFIPWIY